MISLPQLPGWSSRKKERRAHAPISQHMGTAKQQQHADTIKDGSGSQRMEGNGWSQAASLSQLLEEDGGGADDSGSPQTSAAQVIPSPASIIKGRADHDGHVAIAVAPTDGSHPSDDRTAVAAAKQQPPPQEPTVAAAADHSPSHSRWGAQTEATADGTSQPSPQPSQPQPQRRTSLAALLALGSTSSQPAAAVAQPVAQEVVEQTRRPTQPAPLQQMEAEPSDEDTDAVGKRDADATAAEPSAKSGASVLPQGAQSEDEAQPRSKSASQQAEQMEQPMTAPSTNPDTEAPTASPQQQLQALLTAAQKHAAEGSAGHEDGMDIDELAGPSSLLQQAAARVASSSFGDSHTWAQKQSAAKAEETKGVDPAAASSASVEQSINMASSALAAPLLLAHVLDELIAPTRREPANSGSAHPRPLSSNLSVAALRHMAHTLGTAVQRGHSMRGARKALLQHDLRCACDSIQRAMRWLLIEEADGGPLSSAVETFLSSLCRSSPSLMLFCLLTQLDELIKRCLGETQDSDATPSPTAAVIHSSCPSSPSLRGIPLLDLAELACRLTRLAELALLAESRLHGEAGHTHGGPNKASESRSASASASAPVSASLSGPASTSSGSAFALLLSSFGIHWRDVWLSRFIGGSNSSRNERSSIAPCAAGSNLLAAAAAAAASPSAAASINNHGSDPSCTGVASSSPPTHAGWLRSSRLAAHSPMLQAALWQLLGRVRGRQQADDISQLAQPGS